MRRFIRRWRDLFQKTIWRPGKYRLVWREKKSKKMKKAILSKVIDVNVLEVFKRRNIFIVLKLVFKHYLRFTLSNPHQIPIISLLTQSQTFLFKAIRAYRFSLSFKFAHLSSARILIQVMYITFTFQCRRSFFC